MEVLLVQNPTIKCKQSISYASRLLNFVQQKYTTIEREALAMVHALYKYWYYVLDNKFLFYIDYMALMYLINKPLISQWIA